MSTEIASAPLSSAPDLFASDMVVDFQRPVKKGSPEPTRSPSPTPSSSSQKLEDVSNDLPLHDEEESKPKLSRNGKKAKSTPPPTQDISHLPVAREEALATFESLDDNWYQYSTLGKSREALESMTCDCVYEHGVDDPMDACGPHSDCINRLTQVECLPDDCRCRKHCQNQRFQRKAYGNIEVVLTEKKGYGLRAEEDLPQDTFIYEYIGDVVSQPSFMKRMRDYANEGIRHFYFMMLQKDEFVDATKRGGIGRFANHSCNPNCYVAKWTVGERVRMGIFAKRRIAKGEELTFNYNVDRYGHEAQPCYCGEPNCVGFIGGKTQTDIVTVDDLYLDALGISDADRAELKGNRKKKGKKLDDPDFQPTLYPIKVEDVPKIVQAIRQPPSKRFLIKILTRIKITTDEPALRQLMRLRGFSMMTNIFGDYAKETEVVTAALECMQNWPLVTRNKVDDSKIIEPVTPLAESENETIKSLAQKLLDHWATLQVGYRIPKRKLTAEEFEAALRQQEEIIPLPPNPEDTNADENGTDEAALKRARYSTQSIDFDRLARMSKVHHRPAPSQQQQKDRVPSAAEIRRAKEEDLAAVLRAAAQQAEEEATRRKREEEERLAAEEKEKERQERKKKEKERTKGMSAAEREAEKEAVKFKRLQKLIAQVVSKSMSKYAKDIPKDTFKKYSQELTLIIAEKEKNSTMYKENKLDALTPEKVEKIKKFAKPYIQKVLHKLKKRSKKRPGSKDEESATPTTESPTVQLADEVGDLNMDTLDDMDMDVDDASDEDSAKNGHDNETPAEVDPATPVSPDALPESNADPRLRTADPRRPSQELTKPMSVGPS